jgi:hypothetical protein
VIVEEPLKSVSRETLLLECAPEPNIPEPPNPDPSLSDERKGDFLGGVAAFLNEGLK